MNTVLPINRCFNPVRVVGQDGINFYPCGKCAACRKSYHSLWRNKLLLEMQRPNTYTLAITLTYDNKHLPLVYYDSDGTILNISRTKFNKNFRSPRNHSSGKLSYRKFKNYNRVYDSNNFFSRFPDHQFDTVNPVDCPHWVSSRHGDSVCYDTSNSFAICLRQDVQDFVKRLRNILNRSPKVYGYNTSFSYFICSEYGPKTFRPHFHGLLFFHDPYVAQLCNDSFILKAWSKCDTSRLSEHRQISSFVNSKTASAAYVSKYVTCDSPLPSVLTRPCFRPFHLQSSRPAIGSLSLELNDMVDKVTKGDILHHTSYYDKEASEFVSIDMPYPSSLWSRLFPKFLFEGSLSDSTLLQCFQRIYDHRNTTLPNFCTQFNNRFGLYTPFYSQRSYIKRPAPSYTDFKKGLAILSFCNDSVFLHTYGSVLPRLINNPNFLDYYLFGIPQNLTACRKILHCMQVVPFCSSPHSYFKLFTRFRSLCDTVKLQQQYEYSEHLLSLESYNYTPAHVAEVYPSFYCKLRPTLDSYNDLDYFDFDFFTFHRFGLPLSEFYDDNGDLLRSNRVSGDIYANYQTFVACHFKRKHSNALYNYDKYNDY